MFLHLFYHRYENACVSINIVVIEFWPQAVARELKEVCDELHSHNDLVIIVDLKYIL